jgi:Na+-driven multidrug efflux pump
MENIWETYNAQGFDDGSRAKPGSGATDLSTSLLGEVAGKPDEEVHGEWYLLGKLALPLLVANVAEEISTLAMYIFWANLDSCTGQGAFCAEQFEKAGLGADSTACPSGCAYDDGTNQLAAANDMYSGTQFSIVVIFGAQQAVYTMAPQAAGAGNNKQVGVLLQLVLFWSIVVLGVPTALSWIYMNEAMDFMGLIKDDCADAGVSSSSSAGATHHRLLAAEGTANQVDIIGSYGLASVTYLGPYVLMYTLMTWLESIEEVKWAEPLKAVGSVTRLGLAYVFMWSAGYGLNGYAYASAVGYGISCVLLLIIVFWHQGAHKPFWFGWDFRATMNVDLNYSK